MIQKSKSVSPMSNEGRNAYVIEHINEALFGLLKEKSLNEISISEICETAGVGRMSFYRNYSSVRDILSVYLTKCTDEWWQTYISKPQESFNGSFWKELLAVYKKNEKLILLIYKNDLSSILKEHVFSCCGPKPEMDDTSAYICGMIAGMIYGFIDEWIKRGMDGTPNIADIEKLIKFISTECIIKS